MGHCVDKNKFEAVKWLKRASDQGYADATTGHGKAYFFGEGTDDGTRLFRQAIELFRQAAKQGHAEAQTILGGLLPFHGSTWFFKFLGSSGTVLGNEGKMKTFLDSVQLEDSHH